jgi:GNAT superfamily N-acetyltransferase
MGWVVRSHGLLYSTEYGYNDQYEATVAEIVAKFIRRFDPKRERCWIAEIDGENVGSIFCVKESEKVARLRLLLVEQKARGCGIGTQLVNECLKFARQSGYRKIVLWTQSNLHDAREIYKKFGFHRVQKKRHRNWGRSLIGETWELRLK